MVDKIKKYLPEILTALGVIGAGIVGVSAAVAQHKIDNEPKPDDRKELLKLYIKHYAIPAIIFAATSGCIVGSNRLSNKRYDVLLKRYASIGAGFAAYRTAVVDKYGQEVDDELCEESIAIMQDPSRVNLLEHDIPCEKLIFEEPVTGIRFEMYERDVLLAEYHLNRIFALDGGKVSLSELFYFLGIDAPDYVSNIGWTAEHGYYWIDISHLKHISRHGTVYYELNYMYPPDEDYEEYVSYYGEDVYQEPSYVGNV